MKKFAIIAVLFVLPSTWIAADEFTVTLEFTGVIINGGSVYVAVYNSAESFRNELPHQTFILEPSATTVSVTTHLSTGYYRVSTFQDRNGNGRLDTGLFGIPKEPIGISNYSGRGIPGNFDRLKLWIGQGANKVTVNLAYYR